MSRIWIGSVDDIGERSILAAGFVPVLRLAVLSLPWCHWLRVSAAAEADAGLVGAACEIRASGGRPCNPARRRDRNRAGTEQASGAGLLRPPIVKLHQP